MCLTQWSGTACIIQADASQGIVLYLIEVNVQKTCSQEVALSYEYEIKTIHLKPVCPRTAQTPIT